MCQVSEGIANNEKQEKKKNTKVSKLSTVKLGIHENVRFYTLNLKI